MGCLEFVMFKLCVPGQEHLRSTFGSPPRLSAATPSTSIFFDREQQQIMGLGSSNLNVDSTPQQAGITRKPVTTPPPTSTGENTNAGGGNTPFVLSNCTGRKNALLIGIETIAQLQPTRKNILSAMKWLVDDAQPNDSLFLFYSGHGSQVIDRDGDEGESTEARS
ncbi:hypothetical protein FPQ18DRAFT_306912 [Pyronema domesticum]|nr:hypothetical protein FPQ18DRAFT_306912 [Pyronema domesticum]